MIRHGGGVGIGEGREEVVFGEALTMTQAIPAVRAPMVASAKAFNGSR
jgi:hypothetical protein